MSNAWVRTANDRLAALRSLAWGIPILLALGLGCSAGAGEPATTTAASTPPSSESTAPSPDISVGTQVGNTLPHFEFTLLDGDKRSTEQLAADGKPVFLYFFATW